MKAWEDEIAFYIDYRGIDPEKARIVTILRWMYHGDFRPLAAAIGEERQGDQVVLDAAILNLLAQMIDEDRLRLVSRKRAGRNKSPEAAARNIHAAIEYENARSRGHPSKKAFKSIAEALCISEQTIRQAVTAWRKAQRKHTQ